MDRKCIELQNKLNTMTAARNGLVRECNQLIKEAELSVGLVTLETAELLEMLMYNVGSVGLGIAKEAGEMAAKIREVLNG